jgi:hypothetical protein
MREHGAGRRVRPRRPARYVEEIVARAGPVSALYRPMVVVVVVLLLLLLTYGTSIQHAWE